MTQLERMSLEQLSNAEVTSVSKTPGPLRHAPATVHVITHESIVRSGATSLPEILRLSPILQVTQLSSSNYALGARGFGGHQEDQNFANKLLILIDGRSVYSPLFSGVYAELGLAERPDAVILDINMPDMTGYDEASSIRREAWGRRALLVAVTGWGQEDDKERARAAGFDHHLTKPVDADQVESILSAFLQDRQPDAQAHTPA